MMHGQRNIKLHSTCFGRFLCPSSGVLETVVTTTGACHESGWCISSKDVQGRLSATLCHPHNGYTSSRLMTCISGCYYSF